MEMNFKCVIALPLSTASLQQNLFIFNEVSNTAHDNRCRCFEDFPHNLYWIFHNKEILYILCTILTFKLSLHKKDYLVCRVQIF